MFSAITLIRAACVQSLMVMCPVSSDEACTRNAQKRNERCRVGHTQANITYRYVNANVETAKRAAAALDAFNTESLETVNTPELVHWGRTGAKLRLGVRPCSLTKSTTK